MSQLYRFLRSAGRHLVRSPGVAAVTVGTITMVFFIIGVFLLLAHNVELVGARLAAGLRLSVYLEPGCTPQQKQALRTALASHPGAFELRFVDQTEAASRFRALLGGQAYLLDGLEENPLPESFEVGFDSQGRRLENIQVLADTVAGMPGVEEVQYGQAWLDRFFEFSRIVRGLGWLVGGVVFLVAVLIVSNTIRLSVYARKEEISILKLVGATNGFIKGPFYMEGMALGFAGALFGMLCTYLIFTTLLSRWDMPGWLGFRMISLDFIPVATTLQVSLAGGVLGLIGSVMSLGKYLKKA